MLHEFIKSVFLIFIAEMGDKTQILAMAFATQFKVQKVLLGIFIGSFLNHGLAVLLGSYLSRLIPISTIQVIAGFSFIGFSLWTLRVENDEEKEKNSSKYGPILTVAIAFFIGELGDKTQLTAITLASDASFPVFILTGTVTGMVITGGLGIFVGSKLGSRVSEFTIKIISAFIFMFFGINKLYSSLPKEYFNNINITIFFVVLALVTFIMVRKLLNIRKKGKLSTFEKTAQDLYEYHNNINKKINNICLGESYCGECKKNNCIIGYTKSLINNIERDTSIEINNIDIFNNSFNKIYNEDKIIESLGLTLSFLMKYPDINKQYSAINKIRQNLEKLLFNRSIGEINSFDNYFKTIEEMNKTISYKITEVIKSIKESKSKVS